MLQEMVQERVGAVIVSGQPENYGNRQAIVGLAAETHIPMVYPVREFVDDGGLISYGANVSGAFHRLAGYVDGILRGAKPGDIPIYQMTRLELVLNMKTAKALGLTFPTSLLIRADEIIE